MATMIEQHNLQLLNEQVNSLLENEQCEHPLKDNITFNFERPQDLLESDIFPLLFKPASVFKILEGHEFAVCSVAFPNDSKLIASASADQTVRLWNFPNGDLNAELKGHEETVFSVAFSPDGKSIVTGSRDHTVRSVAWSPNGDVIASGSRDDTVILWDAISGSMKKKLKRHTSWVCSVSFSQNGDLKTLFLEQS